MNKRTQAKLQSALEKVLVELGAKSTVGVHSYKHILETKAGPLLLLVNGESVFARFENVEVASKLFGPYDHFNTYSGKWNHHFFDWPVDEAAAQLQRSLNRMK